MTHAKQHNPHNVRELELFAINSHHVYTTCTLHVIENLGHKLARRKYSAEAAPRAWYHVAVAAAKQYAREFDHVDRWHKIFSVADRKAAADTIASHYRSELIETARRHIGPEIVSVELHDWSRDTYGNPTAHHTVISEGGTYTTRGGHRLQVGYSDKREEGCPTAMERAGMLPSWYTLESAEIDRGGYSVVRWRREDTEEMRAMLDGADD